MSGWTPSAPGRVDHRYLTSLQPQKLRGVVEKKRPVHQLFRKLLGAFNQIMTVRLIQGKCGQGATTTAEEGLLPNVCWVACDGKDSGDEANGHRLLYLGSAGFGPWLTVSKVHCLYRLRWHRKDDLSLEAMAKRHSASAPVGHGVRHTYLHTWKM